MDTLGEAWRIAAWAPDDARELATANAPLDEDQLVIAYECLARVFAVTASWALAYDAYIAASLTVAPFDAARAAAFCGTAAQLPLAPFARDRDATAAEIDLVARCVAGETPIVRRSVVEIRRALAPRAITGRFEAAFGLAPEDTALAMAAVASIVDPASCAPRTASAWHELLAPSLFGRRGNVERLVGLGLCVETPVLVPHGAVVGRLLGRTTLEQPPGIVLDPIVRRELAIELVEPARELALRGGLAVIVGPAGSGRHACAARIAELCGRAAFAARPGAGAADFASAAIEAGLHDGFAVFDLEAWATRGVAPDLGRHCAFVIAREDPAIALDRRAFTLHTA